MITIAIHIAFSNDSSIDIQRNSLAYGDIDGDSVENGDRICSYSTYRCTHRVLLKDQALWCHPS